MDEIKVRPGYEEGTIEFTNIMTIVIPLMFLEAGILTWLVIVKMPEDWLMLLLCGFAWICALVGIYILIRGHRTSKYAIQMIPQLKSKYWLRTLLP